MEQKLAYSENILPNSKYIAIIEPGLGSYRGMPHIVAVENAMIKSNISTFTIDPLNSLGESSGSFENATFDSHLESLKLAIDIVRKKYSDKKIIIFGHSVSAMVVLYYAANNNDISAVISLAPMLSGKIYANPKDSEKKKEMEEWKKTGYRLKTDKNGKEYGVSYRFVESLQNIDLMNKVDKIKVSTLLIANEKDKTTDLEDLKLLSSKLNKESQFVVIPNAPHLITNNIQLKALEDDILNFLKQYFSLKKSITI